MSRVLLVIYDNGSHVSTFPQGTAYIASELSWAGHEVEIYNQDVHHWPDEYLTIYLNEHDRYDAIGIGVIGGYWQYKKLLGLSKAINASKHRPGMFIIGGHGPAPAPEYFLKKTGADFVIRGEGEVAFSRLVNGDKPMDIDGLSFMGNGGCVNTPDARPLEIDKIEWPAYHMFPIEYYRLINSPNSTKTDFVMPVASARGCTFGCNFCYRMVPGYRPRNPVLVCEEIKFLQKEYGITYIDFSDELLMASEGRVHSVCDAISSMKTPFKWCCNGRLNYATPEILKRMRDCGCVFINYGIESFDNYALEMMGKHLTTDQIVSGVENTINAGISPGLNIIFGNLGETKDTLWSSVRFLLKYADASQFRTIRPVTPYPGSRLFKYAVDNGLLGGVEDFYERKHVNSDLLSVNFTNMTDDEFYNELSDANKAIAIDYYNKLEMATLNSIDKLYSERDSSFRGFRQS